MKLFRRIASLILISWALGFAWFAVNLPRPAGNQHTDAVVVLTGGAGRVDRGLEVLRKGWSEQLFVSGVDHVVKPREFSDHFKIADAQMQCCVTLGYSATDTISNARETAEWIRAHRYRTVRLVTSDWHMRRADFELKKVLGEGVTIIEDAVATEPSLRILMVEYHKLIARNVAQWQGA